MAEGRSLAYLRFVVAKRDPQSGVEAGVFSIAYALREDPNTQPVDRASLDEDLSWFEQHLATPDRFNRTSSKGHYRRTPRAIAWFRDDAAACLSRMHDLKRILESYGHAVQMIREDRVGYIVYEDDVQVVAEPFADTRTRG